MESEDMRLVYQDQQILIVHKPSGWTIYAEDGVPKSRQLHAVCSDMLMEDLHPVHRLDRPTCGLVVFANSGRWARLLQEQFAGREVKKTYLAMVHGHLTGGQKIDIKLREKGKGEVTALSNLKAIGRGNINQILVSLVELTPETGRFHQLRKHCKLIGHPIVGDLQYGLSQQDKQLAEATPLRLMLSAVKLSFEHPKAKKQLMFTDTPDRSFLEVLEAAGLSEKQLRAKKKKR